MQSENKAEKPVTTVFPISRNESLTKTLGTLVGNGHLSDALFLVEDKYIAAHRFLLAIRSSVFEAMFYGPASTNEKVIVVNDCRAEAFETMLLYIYTNDINLDIGNVVEVMLIAHKYDLEHLELKCEKFIEENRSPSNVIGIYDTIYALDAFAQLKRDLMKYITDNFLRSIMSVTCLLPITSAYTLIPFVEKLTSLKGSEFNNCDLFEMLVMWARKQCLRDEIEADPDNVRTTLGGALRFVDITVMDPAAIAKCVKLCPLFSQSELNFALLGK